MRAREYQTTDELMINSNDSCIGDELIKNGTIHTVVDDDDCPVAIMGCTEYWKGVGLLWAFIDKGKVKDHPITLTRIARLKLAEIVDSRAYHRIHAFVYDDHVQNGKWLKVLGLKPECTMRRAAPNGNDVHVYVRLL